MATQDRTAGVVRSWEGHGYASHFRLTKVLNFLTTNEAASDVIQCIPVPANHWVMNVWHLVKVAEGGVTTCTVGDGTDPNGFIATADNDAAASTLLCSSLSPLTEAAPPTRDNAFAVGKFYATADTIDITLSAAAVNAGKIVIAAELFDESLFG